MFSFIWKDLLHHRSQTIFNLLGLAVVVFSYLLLVALASTMEALLQKSNLSRNLLIVQADAAILDESNISPEVVQAAEDLLPGPVSRVAPIIYRTLRINDSLIQLRASPLADWEPVFQLILIEGRWPSGPQEIAIGEGAQIANGWVVGTKLNIFGRDFSVTGIFRSPGMVFASIWMPLETAQDLFAPRRDSQLLTLQIASGSDPEAVRSKLEQDPRLAGQYALFYEDNLTRRRLEILHDIALLVRIVATVALVTIVFGTYNLTSLSLEERRREAGILRALGFSPSAIRLSLSLRALLLGLAAYLLALLAAWVYMTLEKSLAPVYVLGVAFLFQLSFENALTSLAWMLALPTLGAWLATRRLLQDSVVSSLQRN
jgi:putative ABC transport system permease protein